MMPGNTKHKRTCMRLTSQLGPASISSNLPLKAKPKRQERNALLESQLTRFPLLFSFHVYLSNRSTETAPNSPRSVRVFRRPWIRVSTRFYASYSHPETTLGVIEKVKKRLKVECHSGTAETGPQYPQVSDVSGRSISPISEQVADLMAFRCTCPLTPGI